MKIRLNRGLALRDRRNRLFFATVLLIVLLYPIVLNPHAVNPVPCRFVEITGYACPTCGISRSLHALVHLRPAEAFLLHPFGPLLYIGILVLFVKYAFEILAGIRIEPELRPGKKIALLAVLFSLWIIFWFARVLWNV